MGLELITEYAPVIIRQMRGQLSDETVKAQLDGIAEQLALADRKGIKIVTVVDMAQAARPNAVQRSMQSAWFEKHEEMLRRVNLGSAFVVRSQLVRGAITAVFWMRPLPHPHTVVTNLGDALDWAIDKLRAANITPPDRLVYDRASALLDLTA